MNPVESVLKAFPGAEVVGIHKKKKKPVFVDHTKKDEIKALINVDRAQGCSHPIRLKGSIEVSDHVSGDVLHQWSSERDESSGSIYVPCKTRRADKCESCARLYQGDAFRLIVEGLRGGDFISESVKDHSALFITFTAPSFGPVHNQVKNKDGKIAPCRPRRGGETCRHGNELSCGKRHQDEDPKIGTAICKECFDYQGAALWNHFAGILWRQTRNNIDRSLAKILGVSRKEMRRSICRTQFVKIAEFQRRGLVHFHVAIRIDGPDGTNASVSIEDLIEAVKKARETDARALDERITWGAQLDIKIIGKDIKREELAGYFAKYATKGSDAKGLLNSRIRDESQIPCLPVNKHLKRLVQAAWDLASSAGDQEEINTDRWAHQFGFGGHFLTKSRETQTKEGMSWQGWSTTFKTLRQRRSDHHAEMRIASWQALSPQAQLVIEARWEYEGSGYATPTDAHVAALRNAQHQTSAKSAA